MKSASREIVSALWDEFEKDLQGISTLDDLVPVRDKFLSRQRGLLTLKMRELGALPKEERPEVGKRLNQLKARVEEALEERVGQLKAEKRKSRLQEEFFDVSLPGYVPGPRGHIHPVTRMKREIEEIFVRMGFTIVSGPEIESDYYNFEALNIPKGHPAREDQDTFYLNENLLLRTHTSPVQIRVMENQDPPLRIAVPGRVFRRDSPDATHTPMFHQVEVLVVDEGITLAHLKGTLQVFIRQVFGEETRVRFRPSFFPFVEPGAELDIGCIFCSGLGCRVCKQSGWIEILGAGMVHPKILQRVGYDPEKFTGFAWGLGIDRIAILKYKVDDSRLFFENDLRFLRQF